MSDAETIKLWLEADLAFDDGEGLANPDYVRIVVRALLRAIARLDKIGEHQLVSEIRATFEVYPGDTP